VERGTFSWPLDSFRRICPRRVGASIGGGCVRLGFGAWRRVGVGARWIFGSKSDSSGDAMARRSVHAAGGRRERDFRGREGRTNEHQAFN
jgi:hypothetical protein